jgi:hypothetical protein
MSQPTPSSAPNVQVARDLHGAPFAKVFSWPGSSQVLSIHQDGGQKGSDQLDPHLVITSLFDGYLMASTRLSFRKNEEDKPDAPDLSRAERDEVYLQALGAFLDRFGADDAQVYVNLLASTLEKHASGLKSLRALQNTLEDFGLSQRPSLFVRVISVDGRDVLTVAQNEEIPGATPSRGSDQSLACVDVIHGRAQKRYTFTSRAERDQVLRRDAMLQTMGASVLAIAAALPTPVSVAHLIPSRTAVADQADRAAASTPAASARMKP